MPLSFFAPLPSRRLVAFVDFTLVLRFWVRCPVAGRFRNSRPNLRATFLPDKNAWLDRTPCVTFSVFENGLKLGEDDFITDMAGTLHQTARTISVVAGTLVALSCGTNVCQSDFSVLPNDKADSVTVCIFSVGTTICSPDEALLDREQLDRES